MELWIYSFCKVLKWMWEHFRSDNFSSMRGTTKHHMKPSPELGGGGGVGVGGGGGATWMFCSFRKVTLTLVCGLCSAMESIYSRHCSWWHHIFIHVTWLMRSIPFCNRVRFKVSPNTSFSYVAYIAHKWQTRWHHKMSIPVVSNCKIMFTKCLCIMQSGENRFNLQDLLMVLMSL